MADRTNNLQIKNQTAHLLGHQRLLNLSINEKDNKDFAVSIEDLLNLKNFYIYIKLSKKINKYKINSGKKHFL